jgi:hypothetical protein
MTSAQTVFFCVGLLATGLTATGLLVAVCWWILHQFDRSPGGNPVDRLLGEPSDLERAVLSDLVLGEWGHDD